MKIEKGQVIEELAIGATPGAGAVQFIKELLDRYSDEYFDEFILLRDIEEDKPEIFEDKRVRKCCACGFYFRDKSKPNSAVVCSDECRAEKNKHLRNIKRREQSAEAGTKRDRHYSNEYGFYASDEKLMESDQRHIVNTADFEKTVARSQIRQINGGKKRVTSQNIDDIKSKETKRSREFWGTTWATAYDNEE